MALNQKQEKFCLAYAKSGNARQSYLGAGYKCKPETADASACQLLKNPKVQKRLAELYEDAKNDSIADISEMQAVLTSIIRRQMCEEVIVDGEKMEKTPSLEHVIKAINVLGKMQGAFALDVNVNGNIGVTIIDDLGD